MMRMKIAWWCGWRSLDDADDNRSRFILMKFQIDPWSVLLLLLTPLLSNFLSKIHFLQGYEETFFRYQMRSDAGFGKSGIKDHFRTFWQSSFYRLWSFVKCQFLRKIHIHFVLGKTVLTGFWDLSRRMSWTELTPQKWTCDWLKMKRGPHKCFQLRN